MDRRRSCKGKHGGPSSRPMLRFLSLERIAIIITSLFSGLVECAHGASESVEESAETDRPRIGLVLAGGGARGIGHVGVIRLLEELNIQVDYVAGTSMGSIVGGLYSAGFTSGEMVEWLEQCDWSRLLSDSPPREERGYRAKEEELETPRWIEFGLSKSGLKVPNAFISGQNLLVELRQKTDFVGAVGTFDDLPVPFRAVATDVETGEMVVLDRGSLANAMRASMAVPGVFAPYTIDERVLIDGFASRNLPVSVVRDMGADVIIAVDVRPELLTAEELTSPISMAEQLISILSQRDTLEQIASLDDNDVLVRLKLPGYASSSFTEGLDIAQLGYEEAQQFRAALAPLALPPQEYAAREVSRRNLQRKLPVIAGIEVEGDDHVAEAAILNRLDVKLGEVLNPEDLRRSLGRVYDLGYFKSVDYRVEDRPEGNVLVVTTEPKPWGPNFLIFGIGLGSDLNGESELNVRTSMRFTQLNRLGAELDVKTSLGTVDRLDMEFFQPVDYNGTFFIAPRGEFLKKPEALYADLSAAIPGIPLQQFTFSRQTLFGGIAGGMRIGNFGEFRVGVERGTIDNTDVRAPSVVVVGPNGEVSFVDLGSVFVDYTANRAYGTLTLDRLDDAFFPRRGFYFRGHVEREFGQYAATTTNLLATAPFAVGGLVFQPRLSIDYTLDEVDGSGRLPFRVGGLFNLSGLPSDEFFGSNAFVGALIVRQRLGGGEGNTGVFLGGSIEAGNVWDDDDRYLPDDWLLAGSVFVAASSPLGPVHLAFGMAEKGSPTVYFYLGQVIP